MMSWKRAGIAMLVGIPLLMLFAFGMSRGDPRIIPSPLVGLPAPDFALPVMAMTPAAEGLDVTGDTIRLSELHGDVVVLNFFASWCVPCRLEHAGLTRTATRYANRGVRFYGVVYQDTPEAIRRYIRQLGGQSYPSLLDPGQRVAIDWGLVGVPETFFIGKDGTVRRKIFSVVTEQELVTEIERLLAEPGPTAGPANTPEVAF
jgi:cytochrome c biogenesis protein CcmG, thiol:disulfide interchange protein DsbE